MLVVIGNFIFTCFPQHSCMVRSASDVGLFRWQPQAGPLGDQGDLKPTSIFPRPGLLGDGVGTHSPEGCSFLSVGFHSGKPLESLWGTFLGIHFQDPFLLFHLTKFYSYLIIPAT